MFRWCLTRRSFDGFEALAGVHPAKASDPVKPFLIFKNLRQEIKSFSEKLSNFSNEIKYFREKL
jgi:hypothetical protein